MRLETLAPKLLPLLALVVAGAHPLSAAAEDIDIFVAGAGGSSIANVLIILDNSANWTSQWPNDVKQGQAELKALQTVVGTLNDKVNVGLMMLNNNALGGRQGGYIRYAMQPMNKANQEALIAKLGTISAGVGTPAENTAGSAKQSGALFDAFKYFGGYTSPPRIPKKIAGNPTSSEKFGDPVFASPITGQNGFSGIADPKGYKANGAYDTYFPPAMAADTCGGQNFIIFIGNTFSNQDDTPSQNMKQYLAGVEGDTTEILLPELVANPTLIGNSLSCYVDTNSGKDSCTADVRAAGTCGVTYSDCICETPISVSNCPTVANKQQYKYAVYGVNYAATGKMINPPKPRTADEWARFLFQTDVNSAPGQQNVVTYTIDVYNPNAANRDQDWMNQKQLLYSMANVGGGKYFAATQEAQITKALASIFAEIQAVDSTFASASLPVNATNRALNLNEVYMAIFRPDPRARPLWFGNLKRYQIAEFNGDFKLADVKGLDAVNTLTGFITDCATSWWTNDSGKYWAGLSIDPSPAGGCPSPSATPFDPFSDAPDGPKVEKGGVAEILRQGNVVSGSPTWVLNRTIFTKGFETFNTATVTAGEMAPDDINFIRGVNIRADGVSDSHSFLGPSDNPKTTSIRPTIHGGVVHSRPLAVNYGGSKTVLYYGSDDGSFRAVDSVTGRELWAYVAQEFYPTLPRLRQNSPLIKYSFMKDPGVDPPPQPKNYHFDGSSGLWQSADNSQIWIYPTMRRGGRRIYAFDVTNPSNPSLKWKKGCPNLTNDTGCDAGFSGVGQTWSTPRVVKANLDGAVNGVVRPVLVVGGGYDNCEDGAAAAACIDAKGSAIYVIDADNGNLLRSFATEGRVASDIGLTDVDDDGIVDYAYVGDTRGNLYRISFGPSKTAPLSAANWNSTAVARTHNTNRKFLHAPALVPIYDKSANKSYVYVALGSGDREQPLETQYPYATGVQNRFYVFMDDLSSSSTANLDDASTMSDFTVDAGCGSTRVIPGSNKQGWFMNLPDRGEQTVTSAVVVGGLIAFSTNRAIPASPDVCAPLGEARGYLVNLLTASGGVGANSNICGGERSAVFVGGGLPPSPVVASVEIDGTVRTILIGAAPRTTKSGKASPIQTQLGFSLPAQKRVPTYWRQEGNN